MVYHGAYASQLMALSRRLIGAQEEESRRIARELHDDLSQRLSLLATNLDRLRQDVRTKFSNTAGAVISKRLQTLWRGTTEILADIESISHELHSSTLDLAHFKDAVAILCRNVARRSGMRIRLIADPDLPKAVPREISLCVYRVVQEALRNAIQHSGARTARVEIRTASGEIHVSVSDTGSGFDPGRKKGDGLGLLSMRERVRLVRGQLSVQSGRLRGTRIFARIPIRPHSRSRAAPPVD